MNGALSLAPGAQLGSYELVQELGRGAIGEAFAARVLEGPRAGELLCLKILGRQYHALDSAMRAVAVKSLLHEGRVISQLDHPNIARLLDFGAVGDVWYLALELVEGANLHQLLYRGPLGALHVMHVGFQISKALACAHAHAVVHRDIKPPNVLVGNQGEVKLVDFGLAKLDFASAEFTRHVGTPRYWAPEQLQGEALTPATDIYALGLVLFEALVGAHPFLVPNERDFRQNVLEGRQVVSLRDRGFPVDLVAIVERCIATAPSDRFADGSSLAAAFARAIDSHSLASTLAFVQPLEDSKPLAGQKRIAVEPLSEEHVFDADAETRQGSLAERVADVRDETGDLKTRVYDDPHRRATTAVDAQELAAHAAAMMRYDEAALAKDLSRMARQAREERGAAKTTGEAISAPRPIEHATKHERRKSRPAAPTTEEFVRRPFTTEMQVMPELGQLQPRSAAPEPDKPRATPSAAVRADTEEVTQRPKPSPKLVAVVAVLVVGVGIALTVLKDVGPSRAGSNASSASPDRTSACRTTVPVAAPAAAPVVAVQEEPGRQGPQEEQPQQGTEPRERQQDAPRHDAVRQEPAATSAARAPKRRQVPLERVEVTIGLLPYGEVTVDGKALGQSPVTTTLTAGPHRVVARLGQVQRIKTITVSPQDTRFVIRINED